MKMDEDKYLEKLVDYIMKDQTLETPSIDFTSKVMAQMTATKTNEVKVYKPLISKPILIGFIGFIIALIAYCALNEQPNTSNQQLTYIDFSLLYDNYSLKSIRFSKITIYCVVLATAMFFIQISLLKNHFKKV
jgi:hypothetical protein